MDALPGDAAAIFLLPPFSIGVNSYRKEFAPSGANSFPVIVDPNLKGLCYSGNQTGDHKGCFLLYSCRNTVVYPYTFNLLCENKNVTF